LFSVEYLNDIHPAMNPRIVDEVLHYTDQNFPGGYAKNSADTIDSNINCYKFIDGCFWSPCDNPFTKTTTGSGKKYPVVINDDFDGHHIMEWKFVTNSALLFVAQRV
jgi:hypothetical protein